MTAAAYFSKVERARPERRQRLLVEAERLGQISHRYLVAINIAVADGMPDVLDECSQTCIVPSMR